MLTLDDWPPPGSGSGPRGHRARMLYLRAARKASVPRGFLFTIADIAARDKWACHACGTPVPRSWTAAQVDRAPALTFATAWADGGRFDAKNARLIHYGCLTDTEPRFRRELAAVLTRDLTVKARAGRHDETCTKGHALAGANLLSSSDGRRRCRQCRNDRESGRGRPSVALPA